LIKKILISIPGLKLYIVQLRFRFGCHH